MVLLGDTDQVETCFGPSGDSANPNAQVEALFDPFGDSANLDAR